MRSAQRDLCRVALHLAETDGRHQFYTLARVQAVAAAINVNAELIPWIFAGLLTRDDFEAYYSLRDVPGTYGQLRTDLTPLALKSSASEAEPVDFREQLLSALDWLDLAGDIGDIV